MHDLDVHVKLLPTDGRVEVTAHHRGWAFAEHWLVDADGNDHEVGWEESTDTFTYRAPQVSYGANSYLSSLIQGNSKILFLDYDNRVCYGGDDADSELNPGWDQANAPRHLGQSNVLDGEGAVRAVDPAQINPETSGQAGQTIRQTYWLPDRAATPDPAY